MSTSSTSLGGADHVETDLRQLGRELGASSNAAAVHARAATSDLSLDEILLLHSAGLEPDKVVFGVACVSISMGVWTWTSGSVADASQAFHQAFGIAKQSLRQQAGAAGAVGVLGVDVEVEFSQHRMMVVVTGTAVRPANDSDNKSHFRVKYQRPFLCDLSARDFCVLSNSGWYPLDLVAGASFVHAPRRGMGAAIGQSGQNVELTNYTETLYEAREAAMEELQESIQRAGGTGLVDAKVIDRPVEFARHVVEFLTYGTAIKMLAKEHTHPVISVVVPLDDKVREFDAKTLG